MRVLKQFTARGFLAGFFVLAPLFSALFLLEDEFGFAAHFAPEPGCPRSIDMRVSNAELRFAAKGLENCVLLFASSEGAAGGGRALHELKKASRLVMVQNYEGFAALRALAYRERTKTSPKMIVFVNHHYARRANAPAPGLSDTWAAERFRSSQFTHPLLREHTIAESPSRLSILREILARTRRSIQEQQARFETRVATNEPVTADDDSMFARVLRELCATSARTIFLPLNSEYEKNIGLSPQKEQAALEYAARSCSITYAKVPDGHWFDRVHLDEAGRSQLLSEAELTASSWTSDN